jgi:hypothetical protein
MSENQEYVDILFISDSVKDSLLGWFSCGGKEERAWKRRGNPRLAPSLLLEIQETQPKKKVYFVFHEHSKRDL